MDIKKIIGTAAPWLATALGGPLAGQAVAALSQAMGLKSDAKVDDIQKALAAGQLTGEQLVAMKVADEQFQQAMTLAGFANVEALEGIAAKDRDSARNREIQVRDWTPKVLSGVIIVATVIVETYCAWAVFHHLTFSSEGAVIIGRILGMLDSSVLTVLAYYLGSSSGSAAKTEIMAANSAK